MFCYIMYLFFRSIYGGFGLKWFLLTLLDFVIALIVILGIVAWLIE